jgi:uncharacterized membrane protein
MSETTVEKAEDAVEEKTGAGENGTGSGGVGRRLLIPAAAGVGTLAATVAARKAPDLFRDHVLPRIEDKGSNEAAKVGKEAASKMGGQGGMLGALTKVAGRSGSGGGREKTRRLPIQRWTDVAVPVQEAYDKWAEFEEFPKFMHRVLNVEQIDKDHVKWKEKIWFSEREWEGEITDRRKNDRIAWKTTKGMAHAGLVSFHKLDTNLTRVLVTVDFRPQGTIEKLASGLRFVKRAVQADLARFKAYCELGDAKELEYVQPGERDEQQPESRSNGGAGTDDRGRSDEDRGDSEREQSRQERATRREERRT